MRRSGRPRLVSLREKRANSLEILVRQGSRYRSAASEGEADSRHGSALRRRAGWATGCSRDGEDAGSGARPIEPLTSRYWLLRRNDRHATLQPVPAECDSSHSADTASDWMDNRRLISWQRRRLSENLKGSVRSYSDAPWGFEPTLCSPFWTPLTRRGPLPSRFDLILGALSPRRIARHRSCDVPHRVNRNGGTRNSQLSQPLGPTRHFPIFSFWHLRFWLQFMNR
jgi:hypothetical protein